MLLSAGLVVKALLSLLQYIVLHLVTLHDSIGDAPSADGYEKTLTAAVQYYSKTFYRERKPRDGLLCKHYFLQWCKHMRRRLIKKKNSFELVNLNNACV